MWSVVQIAGGSGLAQALKLVAATHAAPRRWKTDKVRQSAHHLQTTTHSPTLRSRDQAQNRRVACTVSYHPLLCAISPRSPSLLHPDLRRAVRSKMIAQLSLPAVAPRGT